MDHLLLGTVESPKLGISVQRSRWRIGAKNGRWCQGHSKIRRNVRRMIEIAPQGIILYKRMYIQADAADSGMATSE